MPAHRPTRRWPPQGLVFSISDTGSMGRTGPLSLDTCRSSVGPFPRRGLQGSVLPPNQVQDQCGYTPRDLFLSLCIAVLRRTATGVSVRRRSGSPATPRIRSGIRWQATRCEFAHSSTVQHRARLGAGIARSADRPKRLEERGGEAVEVYWQSLLRDVPLTELRASNRDA